MIRRLLLSLAVIFIIAKISIAGSDMSIRLSPSTGETAGIFSNYPSSPWPNHPDFVALAWTNGGYPAFGRTLFRLDFSMLPAGTTVSDARLSLFANPSNNNANNYGNNKCYIRRLTADWDQNTVVWGTQPAYTTIHQVLTPVADETGPGSNLIDIDVTDLINDVLSSPSENYGFIIMLQQEIIYTSANFASLTYSDTSLRPLLELDFGPPPPPPVPFDYNIRLNTSTGMTAGIFTNFPSTPWPNHPDFLTLAWTVGGAPAYGATLFKFNLTELPPGLSITEARLQLYDNPSNNNANNFGNNDTYIRRVTEPWDNTTVTWTTRPATTNDDQAVNPATFDNLLNIDVTNMVRYLYEHPSENNGFLMELQNYIIYTSANFASLTYPDTNVRPLLQINVDDPSPVELSSFTSIVNGNNVTLNWSTASELNNSGFKIERTSQSNNIWSEIAFVNGNGTVNSPVNYSYTDHGLSSGSYKYRLKQLDFNGHFEYFELRGNGISIGAPLNFSLHQNYPNPFNPVTKIGYDIPADGMVTLTVYDLTGREIRTLVNEFRTAGYYYSDFDAKGMSSGMYFYRLISGNNVITKSMMVVK